MVVETITYIVGCGDYCFVLLATTVIAAVCCLVVKSEKVMHELRTTADDGVRE